MAERKRVWKHSDPKKETKKKKRRKIEEAKIPMEKGEIYSDGNCLRNGYPDAKAGTGVAAILSDGTLFALGLKLPGVKQTNNRAELLGLLLSMCMADDQVETMIVSDSLLSIQLVTGEANPKENIDLVESCRTMWKYKPKVSFQWVKGHEDHKGNLLADELADEVIRGSERIVHHEPKEP